MLCDNERICCQSALDLSTVVLLYVSQGVCRRTHKHTFALPLSDSAAVSAHFQDVLDSSCLSQSLCACCLFIRQTICWSCVFFSACHPLGTVLHMAVLYQLSDAHGMPSVGHCPLHRHEVCMFTPGSLSARRRIMEASERESSPRLCS